jgi:protein gp37
MSTLTLPQIEPSDIDRSAIEWTGATWNPWQGCIKVSRACKWCYMYRDKKRYGKDPTKVVRSAEATFVKPLRWQREVEDRKRVGIDRLVFTCSWSDWFIRQADGWRADAWDVIRRCPGLIFQILTKRHDRIVNHLPDYWDQIKDRCWLGVSVEDQAMADLRTAELLKVDAAVLFYSCEPLLGPIDFNALGDGMDNLNSLTGLRENPFTDVVTRSYGSRIGWVIAGGESGPQAEPSHPDWFREIRDQCVRAGVPFFFKQYGEWAPFGGDRTHWVCEAGHWGLIEEATIAKHRRRCGAATIGMVKLGKKKAGRLLDGREWSEFPELAEVR